jgi:potassium-transporting ATPase KdpC subunit
MRRHLDTAIRMTILTAVLLGLLYPLAITGIAQVVFPGAADGSLVKVDGRVVGSAYIAQAFSQAKYFWPRPSAAGASGYDAMASSFSNLGPTSKTLIDRVSADVQKQVKANPGLTAGSVPVDMVTTSASGLDPDITVANARTQATRVAQARGMTRTAVLHLIGEHTTGRTLGFIGEPRVNVLALNLALDRSAASAQAGP